MTTEFGKVLALFVAPNTESSEWNENETENELCPIPLPPNPPPVHCQLEEALNIKNAPKQKVPSKRNSDPLAVRSGFNLAVITNVADDASDAAFDALYHDTPRGLKRKHDEMVMDGESRSGIVPSRESSKRRKLNDGGIESERTLSVQLDSFRSLQRTDRSTMEREKRKKDSLWRLLSDTVYDLHERMRSNDGLKHMIRTNLADKVQSRAMAEYGKLHEVSVKHSIEHCCIWLRIRTSLARYVCT